MIDPEEIEIEPVRGLNGPLPEGERILWQGAPEWRALARDAFHVNAVAFYFGVLILWRVASGLHDGVSPATVAGSAAWLAAGAVLAAAILAGLAYAYARTSVYTLTTRRLVIRSGLALPVTFNLPLRHVESAALKAGRGGVGSVSFALAKPNRIALLAVWPHARPWRLSNPEPMLRSIPDAAAVARMAVEVLRREAGGTGAVVAGPAPDRSEPAGLPAGLAA